MTDLINANWTFVNENLAKQYGIPGVLGPQSNAHGPNEFLHIPTGKRVSMCVARVIAEHYKASEQGLTTGVAASDVHTHHGDHGCC